MPRRVKTKSSILAPAGSLIKRLADTNARVRRKIIRYGLWGVSLFFLYTVMSGTYGLPRIVRLKMEKEALIDANRRHLVELVDAARVREMLKSDPNYIEWIARTRYHLARPDEIIYRYRGH